MSELELVLNSLKQNYYYYLFFFVIKISGGWESLIQKWVHSRFFKASFLFLGDGINTVSGPYVCDEKVGFILGS